MKRDKKVTATATATTMQTRQHKPIKEMARSLSSTCLLHQKVNIRVRRPLRRPYTRGP